MRNRVEIRRHIRVHHIRLSLTKRLMHRLHRVLGTVPTAIPGGTVQKISFENWLQYNQGRHLNHSVPDRRDPKRPFPAVRLQDVHPPHRRRGLRLLTQCVLQPVQPVLLSLLSDVLEGLSVYAGGATIVTHPLIRMAQNVPAIHRIIQRVTPERRLLLRFDGEFPLERPECLGRV